MAPFSFPPIANTDQTQPSDADLARGLPPELAASDEDKARYTVARYAAQNDHYTGFYQQWSKALLFLMGKHWLKWNAQQVRWQQDTNVPKWRQQPVTNLTFAIYRTALAKLTKQHPTLEVVPPSGDSEDREAAELSEAVLTALWRSLRKPQKMPRALGWLLVSGMTYLRVGWDPEAGQAKPRTVLAERPLAPLGMDATGATGPAVQPPVDPNAPVADPNAAPPSFPGSAPSDPTADPALIATGATPEPETEDVPVAADESGNPYTTDDGSTDFDREPDSVPEGDVSFDVVSPMCVRFNPEATSIDDATEMYVATLWPTEKAVAHFKVSREDLGGSDDSAEGRALYEDLLSGAAAAWPDSSARSTANGTNQSEAIGDRVLVIEYYADRCSDYPDGRHWITAGHAKVWPKTSGKDKDDAKDGDGQPFQNGEAPLPFGFWPPLVPVFDTPVPGQPTALGLLPQIVPLNEQLNTLDGRIAEKHVVDSMGGVWWVHPADKGIEITSEPGQVKVSKGMALGQPPIQQEMHALPAAVYAERQVITSKLQTVAGISGLDLAQAPEGVTAGRAFLVIQEASDAVHMPTLMAIEAALEEVGRRELVIVQQKYRDERTIAIKGDKGQYLYRSFQGADLRGAHDVRVQVGSSFPWSKSAQWNSKIELLQGFPQLVLKPDGSIDKEELARYLDAGAPGLGAFDSDEDPDAVEVQREHAMFEAYNPDDPNGSNQLPQLGFWQNNAVHQQLHFEFMKRSFSRVQRWHPLAQKAFMQHMQLTLMAIQDAIQGMMPAEPPGGAAGPPGAPTPGGAPAGPPGAGQDPSATPPPGSTMQLTRGDFASANQ